MNIKQFYHVNFTPVEKAILIKLHPILAHDLDQSDFGFFIGFETKSNTMGDLVRFQRILEKYHMNYPLQPILDQLYKITQERGHA